LNIIDDYVILELFEIEVEKNNKCMSRKHMYMIWYVERL